VCRWRGGKVRKGGREGGREGGKRQGSRHTHTVLLFRIQALTLALPPSLPPLPDHGKALLLRLQWGAVQTGSSISTTLRLSLDELKSQGKGREGGREGGRGGMH